MLILETLLMSIYPYVWILTLRLEGDILLRVRALNVGMFTFIYEYKCSKQTQYELSWTRLQTSTHTEIYLVYLLLWFPVRTAISCRKTWRRSSAHFKIAESEEATMEMWLKLWTRGKKNSKDKLKLLNELLLEWWELPKITENLLILKWIYIYCSLEGGGHDLLQPSTRGQQRCLSSRALRWNKWLKVWMN